MGFSFDDFTLHGEYSEIDHDGFTLRASVLEDEDRGIPSQDDYSLGDIRAWQRQEWFFGYVRIDAYRKGYLVCRGAAYLGGLEVNLPCEGGRNSHVEEAADGLVEEACSTARIELARLMTALIDGGQVMTPIEALTKMQAIGVECGDDVEARHERADALMLDILRSHGYTGLADYFEYMDKYYA